LSNTAAHAAKEFIMASISYQIGLGGNLETVTAGTAAPTSGNGYVEIRMDQTAGAVTDAAYAGNTRQLKKGEIQAALRVLEEYLIRDSNVFQG
jgi:hypothetical protein